MPGALNKSRPVLIPKTRARARSPTAPPTPAAGVHEGSVRRGQRKEPDQLIAGDPRETALLRQLLVGEHLSRQPATSTPLIPCRPFRATLDPPSPSGQVISVGFSASGPDTPRPRRRALGRFARAGAGLRHWPFRCCSSTDMTALTQRESVATTNGCADLPESRFGESRTSRLGLNLQGHSFAQRFTRPRRASRARPSSTGPVRRRTPCSSMPHAVSLTSSSVRDKVARNAYSRLV